LSDGDALGFHPFEKLGQILHLEADVIERTPRSWIELYLALRHRKTRAWDIDAIGSIGRTHAGALTRNAAQDLRVPGFHRWNVLWIKMNVIDPDGHLERRIPEKFQSNAVGAKNVTVARLILLDLVSCSLPFRLRRRQILPDEAEVIHDRTDRTAL